MTTLLRALCALYCKRYLQKPTVKYVDNHHLFLVTTQKVVVSEKIKGAKIKGVAFYFWYSGTMGYRRDEFGAGEWYHIFSRGIDKRRVYMDEQDFRRFEKLLYLANDDTGCVNLEMLRHLSPEELFALPRSKPLVAIGAYCLMNNHPHIVMQEIADCGISRFMHKVGTGYTAYFNRKYDRIGNLMVKPFRAKHIFDDAYLRHVVQYVHLNPAEIFEHGWKQGRVSAVGKLKASLSDYSHSSLPDYFLAPESNTRPQKSILDEEAYRMISDGLPLLESVIEEVATYYTELYRTFEPKSRGRPRIRK